MARSCFLSADLFSEMAVVEKSERGEMVAGKLMGSHRFLHF